MEGTKPCFCLIDNNIVDWVGHSAEYARTVGQQVVTNGYDFKVLANRKVIPDVASSLNAEPVFRHDMLFRFIKSRKLGFIANPFIANWIFYLDLHHALNNQIDKNLILFLPSIQHRETIGLAWWLKQLKITHLLQVILLYRFNYFDFERFWVPSRMLIRIGFRLLEQISHRYDLRIVTDSSQLQYQYRQLTKLPIQVVPIPHTSDIFHPVLSLTQPQSLRLVSLGSVRPEKGFLLLAEAIHYLHKQDCMDGLEFILQCNFASQQETMERTRQKLLDLNVPNVQLIDMALSRESYLELLQESHAVLLPYQRKVYYAQTSGPMTEALAAGKPVVVTDDTWMSDQLKFAGAGTVFCDGSAQDLARAILELRDNYLPLAQKAVETREKWVSFHNPKNFLDLLLQR